MSSFVKTSVADGVLTLVLDRTEKKNALTDAMYEVLADAIEGAASDARVRVILLRSEGDLFTAGNDVGEFAAAATGGPPLNHVARFIHAIAVTTVPLVAAVQGRAIGVGATLLLHCDYVLLADDAQLVMPFVNLALVPEAASTLLLPARIGHARAFAMFALGEPVSAAEAIAWGLANKVVARAELDAVAGEVVRRLAEKPFGSLRATKKLMRDAAAVTARLQVEGAQFVERLGSDEAREAFFAFAQRRQPDFSKFR
jgi:enoyl-CoA hydratase/carnithine racemase